MPRQQIAQKEGTKKHLFGKGRSIDLLVERIEEIQNIPVINMQVRGDYHIDLTLYPGSPPARLNDDLFLGMETLDTGDYSLYCQFEPGYIMRDKD